VLADNSSGFFPESLKNVSNDRCKALRRKVMKEMNFIIDSLLILFLTKGLQQLRNQHPPL
jgi:hypothetical protein